MTAAGVAGRPGLTVLRAVRRVGDVAVAVPVDAAVLRVLPVAVVPRPGRGGHRDLPVEHGQGVHDVRVVGGQLAEAHELLEAAVDDGPLVGGDAAVAQPVGGAGVRVAVLGQPDEVRLAAGRPRRGDRPPLDRALELVGGGLVEPRAIGVAEALGDGRRGGQPGDLGRDGRGRVARLLLPPLVAEGRPVGDQEVGRGQHVVAVEGAVAQEPAQVGHEDRVGGLVELVATGVRRHLAVEQRVARHPPVRLLLAREQEPGRGPRAGDVAVGQEAGHALVEVAGEDLAVRAEVDRLAPDEFTGADRLPPRAGQRGHERTGEGLVLTRLQHIGAEVVGAQVRRGRAPGRVVQPGVVAQPAGQVADRGAAEGVAHRGGGRGPGTVLGASEAQAEGDVVAPRRDVRGGHDVSVRRADPARGQGVRGVELGEPVGRGAGVADRRRAQGRRVQGHEGGHRVVAVGGLTDDPGVTDDGHAAGHHAGVRTTVGRAPTAVAVDVGVQAHEQLQAGRRAHRGVHHDGVADGVGQVAGGQSVMVRRAGGHDGALHAGGVGVHGVGGVALLQVGERPPVGDHVLHRLDVRVVDGRFVDVGQHAPGHGEPDLGPGAAGRADALLAGQVEAGELPRGAGRGRDGSRRRALRGAGRDGRQPGDTDHRGEQGERTAAGGGTGHEDSSTSAARVRRLFTART